MVFDKQAIVYSTDKITIEILSEVLTERKFQNHFPESIQALTELLTRLTTNVLFLDFNDVKSDFLTITSKLAIQSQIIDIVILVEKNDDKLLDNLFLTNLPFMLIEKPINRIELTSRLTNIENRSKTMQDIQTNLNDLFKSYNQLEFLTTILFNDYETETEVLETAILLFLQSQDNYDIHEKAMNLLNSIYYNNQRFINRFSLLRELEGMSSAGFSKIDLFTVIAPIIDELKTSMMCEFVFDNQFLPEKYFVLGTKQLLKDLFTEILSSLSIPQTTFCKTLEITTSKSNYLTNSEDQNIPSIEIRFCSTIEKLQMGKGINPVFQEYGFGYFFIKELLKIFDGDIMLKDEHKENFIETTMTIILPEYRDKEKKET